MDSKGSVLMQHYKLGKLLGQGTFAKVYHARNLQTGTSVAIKIIDKDKVLKVGMTDQIKREISVMGLIKHPNIVQLYEVMACKTKIYFVLEYAKRGELFNKVSRERLKEDVARKYFQQLIRAVDFCHGRGVYHRDLKPENLLLDENENLKVSDFGLSTLFESKRQDGLLHTTCGTPAYVAPEVINRRGYDGAKADIWSCGVILFVLMTGFLPFNDPNLMEMYRKIGKAEFKFPTSVPPEVQGLISKILDPNQTHAFPFPKSWKTNGSKKGFVSKPIGVETQGNISNSRNVYEVFGTTTKPSNLNAFDIISLSAGFDLSCLFEEKEKRKQVRFMSRHAADTILTKFENLAKVLKLKVMKKDCGLVKLEGSKEGRKGILTIDAEIFEVTPSFYIVEMKKCSGDTFEFQNMMKTDIMPALKDIIWTWQGDDMASPILQEDQQRPELS